MIAGLVTNRCVAWPEPVAAIVPADKDPPPAPQVHVDDAARRSMPFLGGPSGIFTVTDDEDFP